MKTLPKFIAVLFAITTISSCTTINRTMREPNTRVDMVVNDFDLSPQIAAEASCTRIFGIDFERLFTKKTGRSDGAASLFTAANVPVIGNLLQGYVLDQTTNYAMYNLMKANPGYDVIFFPQVEKKVIRPLVVPIITITNVDVTARLGKLKTK
jgi:hypothetical protein